MTVSADLSRARCTSCGATARLVQKRNRQGFLTHAWLPQGWRQSRDQTLCLHCPMETLNMTALPDSAELELVADQITQTIYSAPFAQASRRQQELALTSARRILAALAPTLAQIKTSEVTA